MRGWIYILQSNINANQEKYRFSFREAPFFEIGKLHGVGRQKALTSDYRCTGHNRDVHDLLLFQYTVSGQGVIEFPDRDPIALTPGIAFIVWIPGDYVYYLPEDQSHWEFLYIIIKGKEVKPIYDYIVDNVGHSPKYPIDCELIKLLELIFEKSKQKQIHDGFVNSTLTYQFLVELYKSAIYEPLNTTFPPYIAQSIQYIQLNYANIEGLDELANIVGVSKYHFLRQFKRFIGIPPLEYLNKVRVEKTIELLKSTDMTIDTIANTVGYANGNYLSKVFRSWIGTSPGKYRSQNDLNSADYFTLK